MRISFPAIKADGAWEPETQADDPVMGEGLAGEVWLPAKSVTWFSCAMLGLILLAALV